MGLFIAATKVHAFACSEILSRFEQSQPHMGTLARIVIYAPDKEAAVRAANAAFKRIQELEAIFSDYQNDSELNRLCQQAGKGPAPVSPHLFRILVQSQELAVASGGAFDITARPLVNLWRRARRQRAVPNPERVSQALHLTGYQHLKVDANAHTAHLTKPGMLLDLGGIAKGYAADEAIQSLQQAGIESALVALGGDVAVSQAPPGKRGWTIEIATANFQVEPKLKSLLLSNAGVSTSGDAEQFVEIDGVRYSHIIDPRSGMALTGRHSVTVVAKNATRSDALATTVSVMGAKGGIALVNAAPDSAVLLLEDTASGLQVWKSKKWQKLKTVE